MVYIPVGKKESESCMMLSKLASLEFVLVRMMLHSLLWFEYHLCMANINVINYRRKVVLDTCYFRFRLNWNVCDFVFSANWSVQIPDYMTEFDCRSNFLITWQFISNPKTEDIFLLVFYNNQLVLIGQQYITMFKRRAILDVNRNITADIRNLSHS